MSLISEEQAKEFAQSNQDRINKQLKKDGVVYDRWSIVFILLVLSIVAFFIIAKKGNLKYAFAPLVISSVSGFIVAASSARIRKNKYEGPLYYKGEKDCGFTPGVKKNIDGLLIPNTSKPNIFKAPNGTDLVIDKNGSITYAGFGSKFISGMRNDGYLNEVPDECWEMK